MTFKIWVARSLLPAAASFTVQAPAMAQPAATLGGPEGEAQPAPAAPAPAAPTPAPTTAPAVPPDPQVVAFVDQQFPVADADRNGALTAAEFTIWISGLKTAELQKAGQPADAATVKAYADGALAKADADKDGTLTKSELVRFFGG